MSTWTCKGLLGVAGLLVLAACGESGGLAAGPGAERVTRAELAAGDVQLAAPLGYCIDRRSLRQGHQAGFALLARCDRLGVRGFFAAQELALITVTTAPQPDGATAPTLDELAGAAAPGRVIEKKTVNGLPLIRLAAETGAIDGASPQHWRGAFAVNGHLVGLALYAPETGPGLTREGAAILSELCDSTRRASAKTAAQGTPAAPPAQPAAQPTSLAETDPEVENISPFKAIAGLFN